MSNSESTHQSLLQSENRKWNRLEKSSYFVPVSRLSAQRLYHILICTAKSSEKRVDYTETLYCKQSALADLICIRGCRLPGDRMPHRTTVQGLSGRKGEGSKKKK